MKFEIKNRFQNHVQCTVEMSDSYRETDHGTALGVAFNIAVKTQANLRSANLRGMRLQNDYYDDPPSLEGCLISDSKLEDVCLQGVCLQNSDMKWSVLKDVDLSHSNLYAVDFQNCHLKDVDLFGTYISFANFSEAKFENVMIAPGIYIDNPPLQIYGGKYNVHIFDEHMRIGCQLFSFQEWEEFSEDDIFRISVRSDMLPWRDWKRPLLNICKARSEELRRKG